ncbi:hypothetical protein [Jiella pacifica]|nr:hypothetical protein [Jiella pacifica]
MHHILKATSLVPEGLTVEAVGEDDDAVVITQGRGVRRDRRQE